MMEKARTNPKIVERGPKQRDERESGKTSDNDHFIWSVVRNCYCRGCAVCMLDTSDRDSRVCFAFAVLGEYLYSIYCTMLDVYVVSWSFCCEDLCGGDRSFGSLGHPVNRCLSHENVVRFVTQKHLRVSFLNRQ